MKITAVGRFGNETRARELAALVGNA